MTVNMGKNVHIIKDAADATRKIAMHPRPMRIVADLTKKPTILIMKFRTNVPNISSTSNPFLYDSPSICQRENNVLNRTGIEKKFRRKMVMSEHIEARSIYALV